MFRFDDFALASMAAYALVSLVTIAGAPKQDWAGPERRRLAMVIGGTLLAYAASSPWLFLAGWLSSVLPVAAPRARMVLLLSSGMLAAGFLNAQFTGGPDWLTFSALAAAVVLRKGIFPFHFWVPSAFEKGSLPVLNLVLNSHLAAYLIIRFAVPMFPQIASNSLSLLGPLAIFNAVYVALLATVAERPRRILALLCVSQASFMLAGIENRNVEGITGALLQWWVVAFATSTLLVVLRALEVRTTDAERADGFLGLGYHAPRLAVPFAVAALALVGLPGTLGFAAEDLLFHGSLQSYPLLGAGLPLATALNAITALRLVARLFFGRRGIHVPPIPDARPRERWALTIPVVLLVTGGILPGVLVSLRSPTAEAVAHLLGGH